MCPDCRHDVLIHSAMFYHKHKGSVCACELNRRQALEKWIALDRAETRRAVLDELTTKAQAPSFNDVKRVIDENITGGYDYTKCAVEFETDAAAAEIIGLYTPVIMLLVRLQDEAKEARRDALLEACKAECPSCRVGNTPVDTGFVWVHYNSLGFHCQANKTRCLIAREAASENAAQGQAGGEGAA